MKKLDEKQVKRNVSFTVFMILLILSFFIFNPAWADEKDNGIQNQYCWIKGKNFHDFKDAIKKQCETGDLLWAVSSGDSISAWNIEQTIGQYCDFEFEIVKGSRSDGSLYLQCILLDEKSRKRRVKK